VAGDPSSIAIRTPRLAGRIDVVERVAGVQVMIEYLKQFVGKALEREGSAFVMSPKVSLMELTRELDTLDARDFEPAAQCEFLVFRANIRRISQGTARSIDAIEEWPPRLLPLLDAYRGPGSFGVSRSFAYLHDAGLRGIVERDYAELSAKLFPSGAWKSTVILAGSILEATLFDRLTHPAWIAKTNASAKVPKHKGVPVPIDEWKLSHLIDVAVHIGRLPKDPADTIHQVLRDYRNFVHPKKEIRAAHACTEAEGMLAKGALDSVCNYLEANP
jgi:hypothetical protein